MAPTPITSLNPPGKQYLSAPRIQLDDSAANRSKTVLTKNDWPKESGIQDAHDKGIKGAGVLVGVLDTGVDADHHEFLSKLINFRYIPLFPNLPEWAPRDVRGFDTDGHGTHVSGIISGRNTGVAPEAELYVASVIDSETTESALIRVASGIDWLLRQFTKPGNDRKPAVVNMSLGFPSEKPDDIDGDAWKQRLDVVKTFLRALIQNNALPFCAIGNDGADKYCLPGGFKEVIGVGAIGFDGKVASFSGSHPSDGKPDCIYATKKAGRTH